MSSTPRPARSIPDHSPDRARSAHDARGGHDARGTDARAAGGDESAVIEAIAQAWGGQLRAVAARFGLQHAEQDELTQRVRLRIWQARTRDAGATLSDSYGYRAAMSAAIDILRERRAQRAQHSVPVDALAHALPAPEQANESSQLARLEQALATLDEPRRVAARLHLSGYHLHDIATMTGWSDARARNLLYRALDDLRRALDPDGAT